MEHILLILVGKGAPQILTQLEKLKVKPKGDMQAIQKDLDALQRLADRKLLSRSKIEDGLGKVIRNMSMTLGIHCALRFMKED